MAGSGDDREASPYEDNYSPEEVYRSGRLEDIAEEIKRGVQLISPSANEQVNGSSTMLPAGGVMPIVLYDRNRVKVSIIADALIRVGEKENVNAGNGFMLPAGVLLQLETIDEIWVGAATQCTVSRLVERQGGDVK